MTTTPRRAPDATPQAPTRGGPKTPVQEASPTVARVPDASLLGRDRHRSPTAQLTNPRQLQALQRLAGNRATTSVVQRAPEGQPTQPLTIATPIKFSLGHRWEGKTVGPAKFVPRVEAEFSAKPAVTTLAPGQSSTKVGGVQVGTPAPDAPKGTGVEAGVKLAPGGEVGFSSEVKKELPQKWWGADWEVKEGFELSNKGGKFGSVSMGPNWKIPGTEIKYSPNVEFTIARWEPGELPEVAVVGLTPAEFSVPLFEYTTASGVTASIETKVKMTGEVMPDPVKIAQYVVETVGTEALASIGALALPAAMAAIIILELRYAEQSGQDISELSTTAIQTVMHYASSYGAVMIGGPATVGPGSAEAAAKARADLEILKTKHVFEPVIKAKAKEGGIYSKVAAEAKPKARAAAEAEYIKRHPWRVKVFGVPPLFYDVLDTSLRNVGSEHDERWLGVRDAQGGIVPPPR